MASAKPTKSALLPIPGALLIAVLAVPLVPISLPDPALHAPLAIAAIYMVLPLVPNNVLPTCTMLVEIPPVPPVPSTPTVMQGLAFALTAPLVLSDPLAKPLACPAVLELSPIAVLLLV
jgi:hypothetical protein